MRRGKCSTWVQGIHSCRYWRKGESERLVHCKAYVYGLCERSCSVDVEKRKGKRKETVSISYTDTHIFGLFTSTSHLHLLFLPTPPALIISNPCPIISHVPPVASPTLPTQLAHGSPLRSKGRYLYMRLPRGSQE